MMNRLVMIWMFEKLKMNAFKILFVFSQLSRIEDLFNEKLFVLQEKYKLTFETANLISEASVNIVITWFEQFESNLPPGVSLITYCDEDYPPGLRVILEPPMVLYVQGTIKREDQKAVAIVGTRYPSAYGKKVAFTLGKELALQGFSVVSGMAMGIDTEAHRGALNAGGRTIAVLGSGVDVCYPRSNRIIYKEIMKNGYVVSENTMGTQPLPYTFPRRNRIISGLSQAIIVVEAGEKSGTMITVDHGLDQGKSIMSVPGSIYSKQSIGTNKLIRKGAVLITELEDVLKELGYEKVALVKKKSKAVVNLSELEGVVYNLIVNNQPMALEEVVIFSKLNPVEVGGIITALELKGHICRISGNLFIEN